MDWSSAQDEILPQDTQEEDASMPRKTSAGRIRWKTQSENEETQLLQKPPTVPEKIRENLSIMKSLVLVLLTLLAIGKLSSAFLTPRQQTAQVNLGYEIHQGVLNTTGQFYNFSNIPYAKPPIGNLRWSAPVAPSNTSNPKVNTGSRFAICPQATPAWTAVATQWLTEGISTINLTAGYTPPNITTLPPPQYGTSEDCLLLDVLVPKASFTSKIEKASGSGLPVVVWIHGGGYTLGWKTLYGSGAGLVKASLANGKTGVIYVAINYRLGAFGFLSGPSYQQQGGVPNLGLLDQRLALEWVQNYIHLFGGDPNRVTLMGESAGGGSVIHQVTAYGGLKGNVPFQQAISQSGAFLPVPGNLRPESIFQKFLKLSGVSSLQAAQSLSTAALQLVNAQLVGEAPYGDFTFNPSVDGSFAPKLPGQLLLNGQYDTSLKMLIGHNGDEGLYFTSPFVITPSTFLQNVVLVSFPDSPNNNTDGYITNTLYPDDLSGKYGYTNEIARADYIVSEALFSCNSNYLERAFGSNSYGYRFSVGYALHGDDIPYTFYEGPAAAVANDTLALTMQNFITNFVISGNPNGAGVPTFPNYGQGAQLLNLNQTFINVIPDELANNRCAWWQKALYY